MTWFFLALVGHLANGVAFIIDKMLLRSAFTRSATYAGMVGLLSVLALFASPFVQNWPHGFMFIVACVSGSTFIFALWAFFAALAKAEASRVVPIVGSLIPMMTLAGSFVFLGERLTDKTFLGFGLLILATVLLSGGGKGKPSYETVWLAVGSALLFAFASITGKVVYDEVGFLGGLITTRVAAALTAAFILFVLDPKAGDESVSIFRKHRPRRRTSNEKHPDAGSASLAIIGQSLGAVGFFLVQWATSEGSVSIVNAMQTVQYALLVVVALALRKHAAKLLGEHPTRKTILLKVGALVITAVGMYLIV